MKEKLVSWYRDETELRKAKNRKKFDQAKLKPGESLFIFSNRLKNLFKLAYPRHRAEYSNTLIYQYKSVVPKSMRNIINAQIMSHKLKGRKLEWKTVQKCARLQDLEIGMEKQEDQGSSSSDVKEIVINLNEAQGVKKKVFNKGKKGNSNIDTISRDVRPKVFYSVGENQAGPQFRYSNERQVPGRSNQFRGNTSFKPTRSQFGKYPVKQLGMRCHYCNRFGHSERNCWKKLRACFVCGKVGHFANSCSEKNNFRQHQPSYQRPRGRSSSPPYSHRRTYERRPSVHEFILHDRPPVGDMNKRMDVQQDSNLN